MNGDIQGLCSWKKAATADALRRFNVSKLFEKMGIGASAQDLFGEEPETYVHKGDVSLDEPVLLDAQGHGIFIIDGSLSVGGAFTFYASDEYTILVVTGGLQAAHFQQARDTQLVVFGETTITGLLHIDLSDAGFALFRGPVTSRDRVVVDNGVESDVPMFAKKPKGKAREFLDSQDPEELHAKLVRGDELFPAPPKGVKKPPSAAVLKKMTVEEVLTTVTGFKTMQIQDGTINPNYFGKGKPGQPLQELTLIAETYLPEFPESLATLQSLTLLQNKDGARLAKMLRSLPRLRALKKLRLSATALETIPAEIGALHNLEVLEIAYNKSLAALPAEMCALEKLEVLAINGNKSLATLLPEIRKLRLRELSIRDNGFAKLPDLDLDRIATFRIQEPALALWREPARE